MSADNFPTPVEIIRMSRDELAASFERIIGYHPFAQGCTWSESEAREVLAGYIVEAEKDKGGAS